jgi:hypothetical protein
VELIATRLGNDPLVAAVLCWAALAGLRPVAGRWPGALVPALEAVAAALVLSYAGLAGWYVSRAAYFDAAEPTITAVAAAFAHGAPLYPALDAPERYAHVYGPLLFAVHAAALRLIAPTIAVSKGVGVAAALAALALTALTCASRGGRRAGLLAAGGCAALFLAFNNASYWTRAEPLLILASAVGTWGAARRDGWGAAFCVGLAAGFAFGCKATGPLYLLPAIGLLHGRGGARDVWRAAALAASVAALPFLMPRISSGAYLAYFALSARNGITRDHLLLNLQWVFLLVVPAVTAWPWRRSATPSERSTPAILPLAALVTAMLVVAIAAAKPGGGPYHFLPFAPAIACLVATAWPAQTRPTATRPILAVAAAVLLLGLARQTVFVRVESGRQLEPALAAVSRFADEHPDASVDVGYAGTSYLSQARVVPALRRGTYWLDAPAIQEHNLAGLPLPRSVLAALDQCRIRYWLVPAGPQPFEVPSAYRPDGPVNVFPVDFREAFHRRYERTGSLDGFDIWACRPGPRR